MSGPTENSLADLHERIGHAVAVAGKIISQQHTFVDGPSPLRGLELDCQVRGQSFFAQQEVAYARRQMGEDRWQQLNREWNAKPEGTAR